ncbi:16S rRNA (uracil1498-N3)-methyltransferase [Azomonas agilis]|uniref:Ribosomal RNA small subunit methyltransferase E n=1 Tax=Azomonas agilis TaxID=116849 RepID=A0A562IZX7_9GAMM|nr:16S rRNA (uracil(1498)-N(3))-methyltransferase [Azomonas agilis]TWH76134.1 16S rRNA (uracil1498-N3)-methyltransferase [Azomonas agilis]
MRLSRFFVDFPLSLGQHRLPEAQAHYMARVLRLGVGDWVQLFDGSGQEYRGRLTHLDKKALEVCLDERLEGMPESPLAVHLGQGLSRGERMDWAIQKATELGVTEITPLVTERCEVRLKDERADKRLAHWRQIVISACEQCGRSVLPKIHPPMLLEDWLAQVQADLKWVLHPVASALTSEQVPKRLAMLIGPEGGLSDTDMQAATVQGFQGIRLGPRILRTETAPVVALTLAQQRWGDI